MLLAEVDGSQRFFWEALIEVVVLLTAAGPKPLAKQAAWESVLLAWGVVDVGEGRGWHGAVCVGFLGGQETLGAADGLWPLKGQGLWDGTRSIMRVCVLLVGREGSCWCGGAFCATSLPMQSCVISLPAGQLR